MSLILLEQIGGLDVLVEGARLILLNPDADQIAANIVALREPVQRLAGEKLLGDLTLEFDAVCGAWPWASFFRPRGPLQKRCNFAPALTTCFAQCHRPSAEGIVRITQMPKDLFP
jgi:hypothetical protein